MGVQGAAYATIIARFVELITLVVLSHKAKCEFCHGAYTQLFSIDDFLIKRICKKSVLLFVNEIFWVTGMVMVSLAYSQRDGVLSSLSIVSTMGDVFSIVFQGLSVGIGVLVGSSLGAGEYEQAKTYVKKFYILGILIAASVGLLFACLSPVIPMLYSKVEPSQKKLATELIAIYSCFIPFFATSAISYTILKTGGKTFTTFMLDSVLFWVLFIPLAWILAKLTTVPLIVIYIVVQSCDIVKSIIGIIIISKGSWIQNLTVQNETSKVEEVKLNNI